MRNLNPLTGKIQQVFLLTVGLYAGFANITLAEEGIHNHDVADSEAQGCLENSKWLLPNQSQTLTTSEFIPTQTKKNVVLLGEFHDSNAHHQWQVHTLSSLHAIDSDMAIGLEMLPISAQAALDDWVAGTVSLEEFLLASKWYDYWKFDVELYLPILEFARIHKVPTFGLNVERSLVNKVREQGWDNIPEEERHGLTDPAPPKQSYLEILASSFAMHGPGKKSHGHGAVTVDLEEMSKNPKFKRFVQGQQLWDRGMAHAIANIHQASPQRQIVAIMGSGHIMNGLGVPNQLADLGMKDVSVLLPWDGNEGCEMITADVADAVFGVKDLPTEKKDKPKLGVVIENTKDGVKVDRVVEGSVAVAAGIKDGDYISEIAGIKVMNVMEVIEVVQETPSGRWLPMIIQRGEERLEKVAKFPPKEEGQE